MADQDISAGGPERQGFFHPLKSALAAFTSACHTRLELFVTELEEEKVRLKQTLVLTLLLFFGLSLGFILLTIFVVALFWEQGWVFALGGLATLYLSVGIVAAVKLRNKFLARPGLFTVTLDELGKDRDRLRSSGHE